MGPLGQALSVTSDLTSRRVRKEAGSVEVRPLRRLVDRLEQALFKADIHPDRLRLTGNERHLDQVGAFGQVLRIPPTDVLKR